MKENKQTVKRSLLPHGLKNLSVKDKKSSNGVNRFVIESDSNVPGVRATIGGFTYKPHAEFFLASIALNMKLVEALLRIEKMSNMSCFDQHFGVVARAAIKRAKGILRD